MSKKNKNSSKENDNKEQVPLAEKSKYSKLIPQAKKWEKDLPEKYDLQQPIPPKLICVNEINDTWIDIPRYENIIWLGMWFYSFVLSLIIIFIFNVLELYKIFPSLSAKIEFWLAIFLLVSITLYFYKMALFVPRGTPIRFNRKRQKVYVYEHQRSIWPWMRWPTVIKVFNWADIHGEMLQQSGRYDYGHRLSCAVCNPGTYEVVDRFILSWTEGDSRVIRGLWNHCCLYMHYKPVPETPLLTRKPWSWTPLNTIRWPEDMDKESRTAPE